MHTFPAVPENEMGWRSEKFYAKTTTLWNTQSHTHHHHQILKIEHPVLYANGAVKTTTQTFSKIWNSRADGTEEEQQRTQSNGVFFYQFLLFKSRDFEESYFNIYYLFCCVEIFQRHCWLILFLKNVFLRADPSAFNLCHRRRSFSWKILLFPLVPSTSAFLGIL